MCQPSWVHPWMFLVLLVAGIPVGMFLARTFGVRALMATVTIFALLLVALVAMQKHGTVC